ncbi:MAG: efflux RND transporter permease subunit [Myxococcota bacterium]
MAAEAPPERGPIAWMVRHRVAPNLLMLVLLVGGLISASRTTQEIFPEFELDAVTISVPYPGASPEEVEEGIVLVVEEAVRALEGVEEVTATAAEGSGKVVVELEEGADGQKALLDVQEAVARVRTFPVDAEEPSISLALRRRDVMSLQIYGPIEEFALRDLAEQVRDRLLQEPGITQVDLRGARATEIHVEIAQADLRRYGLTLSGVATRLRNTALDLPGGSLETPGGEVLLRVSERRDWARQFAEVPIVTTAAGAAVRLGDVARVSEGFEDAQRSALYNGQPAIGMRIYRMGDQTPESVSQAARRALDDVEADLPPGVHYAIDDDDSEIYTQRRDLLLKNLFLGLVLVLAVLGLFLDGRLAFWVTMGIPTSFLGAFLLLPWMGVTINMISMFAFLIALGIVVDDAIVAGENIHEHGERGMDPTSAAVRGARDVASPIGISILSNVIAFSPLAFIPGMLGKVWFSIPLVVGSVFLISWIESLWILPAHLAHAVRASTTRMGTLRDRFQRRFRRFVDERYAPVLAGVVRHRYVVVAAGVGLLAIVTAYALSGRMGIVLMPKVESDRAVVTARLAFGSPLSAAERVRDELLAGARRVAEAGGGDELVKGTFALVDENTVEIDVYLTPPEVRPLSTAEVTRRWREAVGPLPGVESLRFESDAGGPGRGAALTVELSHRDVDVLDRASQRLAAALEQFPNTSDVDDGYSPGKPQLDFRLRPEARSLGLTSSDVARQVRDAFYGAEALRQQRGRDEVKLLVRRPEHERASLAGIEQLLVRTPMGTDVPLLEIAEMERGRAYTQISRRDGRRTVTVTADVTPPEQTNQVLAAVRSDVLPELVRDYPGLAASFEGRQADMRESLSALGGGFILALVAIYAALAIPFRSYLQPAIVMLAIPFGIVGAVLGHWIMGYSLSVISMMGIVALAGVVVNDSLVMVDYANRRVGEGVHPREAIQRAGLRRFRPILLTTLTTFGGLAPMIFESSRQARFMIPMAISLGYGILFATVITLVLVPALYLIAEDARARVEAWKGAWRPLHRGAPRAAEPSLKP